jgi:hypothetical protein
LVLLPALLALLQTVYFLRTEIAVILPQTKPWLIRACEVYGCRVELPRKVQFLAIDDSDLQEHPEHKQVLVLTSTLTNHAGFAQAYPLLELTLTDIHDSPVMRRTLTPQEYLPAGARLEEGIAPGIDVHIRLPFTTGDLQATGYRVYVTYP